VVCLFFSKDFFFFAGGGVLGGHIVQDKPEGIVLDVERIPAGFQHKVLHKGLWGVVVSLL